MRDLEQILHGYQGMTVISYLTHDRRQGRGGEGREGKGEKVTMRWKEGEKQGERL